MHKTSQKAHNTQKQQAAGRSRSANEAHPEHAPRADRLNYCSHEPQASISHADVQGAGKKARRGAGVRVKGVLVCAQGAAHMCVCQSTRMMQSHRCVSQKPGQEEAKVLSLCNQAHNQKKTAAIRSQPCRPSVHVHPTLAAVRPSSLPAQRVCHLGSKSRRRQAPTNARGRLERATRPCPGKLTERPKADPAAPTHQPTRVIPTEAQLPSLRSDRVAAQGIHESQGAAATRPLLLEGCNGRGRCVSGSCVSLGT
jgi:hypothetical protein